MTEFNIIDLAIILPELVIAIGCILLLILGIIQDSKTNQSIVILACFVLVSAIILLLWHDNSIAEFAFSNLFKSDFFIIYSKILLLISALPIFCLLLKNKDPIYSKYEFPILMLLAILGMMMMISANDFILFYLGLELQSLSLYVLASFARDDSKSSEAGLKYFILGAVASGIMLYGISLIYGFAGSTNFSDLIALYNTPSVVIPLGVTIGMIMVLINIFFKISAVPFHMWTPDVYEGAPTISVAFFATTAKLAAIIFLMRLCGGDFFASLKFQWQQILIFVAASTMLIGAIGAIWQTKLKRLMGYSSITHVGFILIGFAVDNQFGLAALLIYLIIYIVISWGVFAFISNLPNDSINCLQGLSKTNPTKALYMAIFMLSMAGVPPLAGFFGKYYILLSAIRADSYGLALIGVVTSVIASYYYLKIVKVMYFDTAPEQDLQISWSCSSSVIMLISAIINIWLFINPKLVIDISEIIAGSLN